MTSETVSAMPTWDGFLHYVLAALEDGRVVAKRDLADLVADEAGLTAEQRLETIDSGQHRYQNRIGWALSSLVRAEAVTRPERAMYVIADVGHDLLRRYPSGFGEHELREIPAYKDYVPTHSGEGRRGLPGEIDVSTNPCLDTD